MGSIKIETTNPDPLNTDSRSITDIYMPTYEVSDGFPVYIRETDETLLVFTYPQWNLWASRVYWIQHSSDSSCIEAILATVTVDCPCLPHECTSPWSINRRYFSEMSTISVSLISELSSDIIALASQAKKLYDMEVSF